MTSSQSGPGDAPAFQPDDLACIAALDAPGSLYVLTALHWVPPQVGDVITVVEVRPPLTADAAAEVIAEKRDGTQLLWRGRFPACALTLHARGIG